MFKNLEGELRRERITRARLAEDMELSVSTVSRKLTECGRLKYCEARKIRDLYFPHLSLDYLFATDDQQEAEQPKEPEMPIGVRRAIEYHANKRQD